MLCGGAGFINSYCMYTLLERVVLVDNLETGNLKAIHENAIFYRGDIRDSRIAG